MLNQYIRRLWGGCCLVLSCVACLSAQAAITLPVFTENKDVVSSYENCSYADNGNGTSTFSVSIVWTQMRNLENASWGGSGGLFGSPYRAVIIYAYNANGGWIDLTEKQMPNGNVSLEGSPAARNTKPFGKRGNLYYGRSGRWQDMGVLSGQVQVTVNNSLVQDWPALSIRAANANNLDQIYADKQLAAYITVDDVGGNCRVVDPYVPPLPPPNIEITMDAPNWDLGELAPGFSGQLVPTMPLEPICLTYGPSAQNNRHFFIINARNKNGRYAYDSNMFTLKSDVDPDGPGVGYGIVLSSVDDKSHSVLPNDIQDTHVFSNTGKSCIYPAFIVDVPKTTPTGIYSDELVYEIIAAS